MRTERPTIDAHRIDEELVCVDSLRHVLLATCRSQQIHIDRQECDPPDFIVTIDGERFPTEVTSITSGQQYQAHCKELAEAINAQAKTQQVLSGQYVLTIFRKPNIPKTKSRIGSEVVAKALSYIEETQPSVTMPELLLAHDNGGRISIKKNSGKGAVVGLGWMAPLMWEGEICDKLTELLQQRVDDKKEKLADKGIKAGEALLLLYAAFAYGDVDDAVTSLRRVRGYEWFHSIFWAAAFTDRENSSYPSEPGREGLFLFSIKPEWHNVGTIGMTPDT